MNSKNKITLLHFNDLINLHNQVKEEYGENAKINDVTFTNKEPIFDKGQDRGFISSYFVTSFKINVSNEEFELDVTYRKREDIENPNRWRYDSDFTLSEYFNIVSEWKFYNNRGEE
tara:strand:- start:2495 stop:2842 length:348 start_codon:yes stop_codon:yes gene_type:complete